MPSRWAQIDELYLAAIERPTEEREEFLADACAGDAALLAEVRVLLSYETRAGAFLEGAALTHEARSMLAESAPSLAGQQIGGYEIHSLVGAGGMGEVYRARDLKLGRDAAIKVLGPFLIADSTHLRRFEEEARLASGLNHPNIVTIYGIGEHSGVTYLAMEFVEGQTLRERCGEAPLTLRHALDLGVQIADALAAAHAIGIIHGDLKPENVMVTAAGSVKVLDFGLARRMTPPGGTADHRGGPVLGSRGYVAPEVIAGRAMGPAADVFSFGAMLYEMFSGRRAFTGEDEPVSLRSLNPEVPARLEQVVTRCLERDPSARYSDAGSLAADIRGIRNDLDDRGLTRRRMLWLGGAVAAGIAGVTVWRYGGRPSAIRSVAVLPFADASAGGGGEHLSDGMTDGLIRRLSHLPSVQLAPRSAVFHFKEGTIAPRVAGQQLGVDVVLAGSVARGATRLLIAAELIDVRTGSRLWSRRFDRAAADIVLIQDEILDAVLDELRQPVSLTERRQLKEHPTDDPDAYEMYLRAMHHVGRETEDDYLQARVLLRQAIARDETFAFAHRALASTYSVMAIDGFERPTEAWPQSNRHVLRALELDPDLPDAHAEAAMHAFFFKWDWPAAEREWQRATRSPTGRVEPDLLMAYALQCFALGRLSEALSLAREARRADPLSVSYKVREADYLFHAGETGAAVELYDRVIAEDPGDPRGHFGLAEARHRQRRYAEALESKRRAHAASGDTALDPVFSAARGEEGYRRIEQASARLQLKALATRALTGYASPLNIARVHAVLGSKEEAFHWLDAAFRDRSSGLVFLNVDRVWDGFRDDPRFINAARRVGLVVASSP